MAKPKPKAKAKAPVLHVKHSPKVRHRRPQRLDVYHHVPGDGFLARFLHEILTHMRLLQALGDKIMSQLDDLKAAMRDVEGKVDDVAADVSAVDAEVKDLIAKLQNLPPSVDLTDAITQAQGISTKLAAIDTALKAIPPEP